MGTQIALRQGTVFHDPTGFYSNSGQAYLQSTTWKIEGSRPDGWLLCRNINSGQVVQLPLREAWYADRVRQVYIGAGPEITYTLPEPLWKAAVRERLKEVYAQAK